MFVSVSADARSCKIQLRGRGFQI